MIVSLNGWPGVGKLSVGIKLAELLGAKLLDNHSMFNVAIALTDFATPLYYEVAREVRDVAFRHVAALPAGIPVILTNVIATGGTSGFSEEHWAAIRTLANRRGVPLVSITLACDPAENARRLTSPSREANRKLRDAAVLDVFRRRGGLFDEGADYRHAIDISALAAESSARQIAAWIAETVKI